MQKNGVEDAVTQASDYIKKNAAETYESFGPLT